MVNLDELRKLYDAANLSELTSTRITSVGYTHLANLTTAPDKPSFVVMERYQVMEYFAAVHNAFPELLEELKSLRKLRDSCEANVLLDAIGTIERRNNKW